MADLWIFPHQLYRDHPGLDAGCDRIVLIEDDLFFGDRRYPCAFHKQKLWLHRASMQRYAVALRDRGLDVAYVEYDPERLAIDAASEFGADAIVVVDPTDFILRRRLERCGLSTTRPSSTVPKRTPPTAPASAAGSWPISTKRSAAVST